MTIQLLPVQNEECVKLSATGYDRMAVNCLKSGRILLAIDADIHGLNEAVDYADTIHKYAIYSYWPGWGNVRVIAFRDEHCATLFKMRFS